MVPVLLKQLAVEVVSWLQQEQTQLASQSVGLLAVLQQRERELEPALSLKPAGHLAQVIQREQSNLE